MSTTASTVATRRQMSTSAITSANLQAVSVGTQGFATSVSRGALARTRISATPDASCARTDTDPFGNPPTRTNGTPTTASNSTNSSPKPARVTAAGPADTGSKLHEYGFVGLQPSSVDRLH